ncbi:cysteine desulfurase [Candidatus Peregrinibacteria bacterium]|nr:MAG: cysteine desulfurase [Candidatus Peregrinibacteria bacterium]
MPIYLDYAAATPLDPRVLKVMQPYFKEEFGNPSSIHQFGQGARRAIDDARLKCVQLLGAFSVHEILFTGSGTESCNAALFGAAFARQKSKNRPGHLIVSAIEHPAVLESARFLHDNFGFELSEVPPDAEGLIHPKAIEAALRPDTILISVMLVNNEVGTLQPVRKIAKLARERGILMHTDACQAPGFTDINVDHLGVDLLSLNGSKIYGPKGIGLLYVREGVKIMPLIHGGGQEFRMRGGTENTALIVGFAKALELVLKDSKKEAARLGKLRDTLQKALLKIPGVKVNGSLERRIQNSLNVQVSGVTGETLVMRLDLEGLAASSGSACSSGKTEASHVLLAMGQDKQSALASLRLTLGRFTTPSEIKKATAILKKVI